MNPNSLLIQSQAAYGQWKEQWREHAKVASTFRQRSLDHFLNVGIGRSVLCVANGYSFEENIEVIKKNKKNCDVMACDKTLGTLLENGIVPKYCVVQDANVNYERYMEEWKDELSETVLFINVCANPKWFQNGNWKEVNFVVNKDVINSEIEFSALSGCKNTMPAATNVSNAMIVLLTQSDNNLKRNFFGYDKILLIGYDYSWRFDGNYYAFSKDGDGKDLYMTHNYIVLPSGAFGYTSGNLAFSCQWLETYVKTFGLPVVQCTNQSILNFGKPADLATQMSYLFQPYDAKKTRELVTKLKELDQARNQIEHKLAGISRAHHYAYFSSL